MTHNDIPRFRAALQSLATLYNKHDLSDGEAGALLVSPRGHTHRACGGGMHAYRDATQAKEG